jgi:hypothetical protein
VVIRNHVDGNFYNAEANQRFFYYPETYAPDQGYAHWMPTVWFNGIDEQTGVWTDIGYTQSVYTSKIEAMQFIPTPLAMDLQVDYSTQTGTGTVHVDAIATEAVYFTDLYLRVGIIESGVNYGAKVYNQILRDYLPGPAGISFSIAEGDTFSHSEDFVIQSGWNAANCSIVAFVQNDSERMVVQCVQDPVTVGTPVDSETPAGGLPERCQLYQNYPNPFNANTEIRYQTPTDGHVTLRIFNTLGQEVRTLVDADQAASWYDVIWDGRDNVGGAVASGLYFCRLQAGEFSRTVKMVLMR